MVGRAVSVGYLGSSNTENCMLANGKLYSYNFFDVVYTAIKMTRHQIGIKSNRDSDTKDGRRLLRFDNIKKMYNYTDSQQKKHRQHQHRTIGYIRSHGEAVPKRRHKETVVQDRQ